MEIQYPSIFVVKKRVWLSCGSMQGSRERSRCGANAWPPWFSWVTIRGLQKKIFL